MRTARIRYWIEVALAVVAASFAALTLITREWIELLFGVDPEMGAEPLLKSFIIVQINPDSALARALDRWRMSQDSLEALFAATRIPTR